VFGFERKFEFGVVFEFGFDFVVVIVVVFGCGSGCVVGFEGEFGGETADRSWRAR